MLIAVHGEEGALGLILNREMNTPLRTDLGPGQRSRNAVDPET